MKPLKNNFWKPDSSLLLMSAVIILSSCNNENDAPPVRVENSLLEIASSNPDFSTLVAALNHAGLAHPLSQPGPFTIFAPTDKAFDNFFEANDMTADDLLASPVLEKTLNYHILSTSFPAENIEAGAVTALSEENFYISEDPTGRLWINGNTEIIETDIIGGNGVLHIIDYVITPPQQNIAEIAMASTEATIPEFTQLVAGLTRVNMLELLTNSEDDFTLFAPTDVAFEDLYKSLGVAGIADVPLETLTDVLLYHVVTGRSFYQDLRDGDSLPTLLEGQTLRVDLISHQINGIDLELTAVNIHGTNGVIHTVNSVLIPE